MLSPDTRLLIPKLSVAYIRPTPPLSVSIRVECIASVKPIIYKPHPTRKYHWRRGLRALEVE